MKVSQSVKIAGLFVAVLVAYFALRGVFSAGGESIEDAAEAQFTVVTETYSPKEWQAEVIVRGRTAAKRKVMVRAETAGVVAETPAIEGALVKKGASLCQIEVDARNAQRAEARASLAKAQLDYDAAVKLNTDGFRSKSAVAAAKAARDLATANLERAEIELAKTKIAAPFDGVFDSRAVEIGDFMAIGDPCGVLIQQSPFLVVGAVAEKEVAKISVGDRGVALLATGEEVEGVVSLIGSSADPQTRTFTVELEIDNQHGLIRDGVTAEFKIFAKQRTAYLVPHSALILGDAGEIGFRSINAENVVRFHEVQLLGESPEGIWISGLSGDVDLIVRGQNFVTAGDIVQSVTVSEAASQAGAGATP
ncbi:MAG: hemolysin D [Hyphococcus sp.]|nr:MAG: hemolysin D [Marinicaulis sp.]